MLILAELDFNIAFQFKLIQYSFNINKIHSELVPDGIMTMGLRRNNFLLKYHSPLLLSLNFINSQPLF